MKAARVDRFYVPRGLAMGRSAGQGAKPDMVGGEALLRRPVRIGQLTGSQITKLKASKHGQYSKTELRE